MFEAKKRRRAPAKRKFVKRGRWQKPRSRASPGELKFHDLDIDENPILAAGAIGAISCNLIAQGVTEAQRIGRKCTIKSINWRFSMTIPTTATAAETSDVCRVILYLDKQANGATATVAGILESADFQSFNNLANKSRFRTLMDRIYDFQCPSGSGRGTADTLSYGEGVMSDTLFKKCNIPIEFDNTFDDGRIATIRTNNIGVLLISQSGFCSFGSKMRLRFSDG